MGAILVPEQHLRETSGQRVAAHLRAPQGTTAHKEPLSNAPSQLQTHSLLIRFLSLLVRRPRFSLYLACLQQWPGGPVPTQCGLHPIAGLAAGCLQLANGTLDRLASHQCGVKLN